MLTGMRSPTRRSIALLASLLALLAWSGCAIVQPVVGTGTAVGKATVKTTGKVAGKVVKGAADAVVPDQKPSTTASPEGRREK